MSVYLNESLHLRKISLGVSVLYPLRKKNICSLKHLYLNEVCTFVDTLGDANITSPHRSGETMLTKACISKRSLHLRKISFIYSTCIFVFVGAFAPLTKERKKQYINRETAYSEDTIYVNELYRYFL